MLDAGIEASACARKSTTSTSTSTSVRLRYVTLTYNNNILLFVYVMRRGLLVSERWNNAIKMTFDNVYLFVPNLIGEDFGATGEIKHSNM